MANRISAPVVAAALVIALIAGVSFWTMRRPATETLPARAAGVAASDAQGAVPADTTPASGAPVSPAASGGAATVEDLLAMQAANDASVNAMVDAGEKKLRTRFDGEPVDAAWASRKQDVLKRLSASPQIEQLNAQPLSIDATCRSSVCLISADFASRTAAEDWFTLYTLNAGTEMFNTASRRTINPDGTVNVRIYGLARQ